MSGRTKKTRTGIAELTGDAARTAVDDAAPPPAEGERPVIDIGTDELRVADEAIAALAASTHEVYQRGTALVRDVRDDTGEPYIAPLPKASLREFLADVARWRAFDKRADTWHPAHPPPWAVEAVHARGRWEGIRPLRGIVEHPVIRPDGTVLATPGYDAVTKLICVPSADLDDLRVPDRPTLDDACAAVATLAGVVSDFPYEKPAHRAAWLAALLTPFARHAFDGYAPLFLFDKNVRGAGGTLQVDALAVIATGRTMPRRAYVPDEGEMKKTVTSVAASGAWAVLFDNVAHSLGGAALDMALTGEKIEDRLFGRNDQTIRYRLLTLWMASGNNVGMHGDLVRRVLVSRLRFDGARPEDRAASDFTHPDLLAWVRENRAALVAAALTVLRAYFVAGRPTVALKPWGSYEAWSAVVRAALVWTGQPDPRDACVDLPDTAADLAARLIAGWAEAYPNGASATVAEAVKMLAKPEHFTRLETLRLALTEIAGKPLSSADMGSLGKRMGKYRDRVSGSRALRQMPKDERGTPWRVETIGPKPSADDADGTDDRNHAARTADASGVPDDADDADDSHTVRVKVAESDTYRDTAVGSSASSASSADDPPAPADDPVSEDVHARARARDRVPNSSLRARPREGGDSRPDASSPARAREVPAPTVVVVATDAEHDAVIDALIAEGAPPSSRCSGHGGYGPPRECTAPECVALRRVREVPR